MRSSPPPLAASARFARSSSIRSSIVIADHHQSLVLTDYQRHQKGSATPYRTVSADDWSFYRPLVVDPRTTRGRSTNHSWPIHEPIAVDRGGSSDRLQMDRHPQPPVGGVAQLDVAAVAPGDLVDEVEAEAGSGGVTLRDPLFEQLGGRLGLDSIAVVGDDHHVLVGLAPTGDRDGVGVRMFQRVGDQVPKEGFEQRAAADRSLTAVVAEVDPLGGGLGGVALDDIVEHRLEVPDVDLLVG